MTRLEVSGAVRPIYGSLGVKGLTQWSRTLIKNRNSSSASQIQRILWDFKVLYNINKTRPPVLVLSHMKPLNASAVILEDTFHYGPGSSVD